MSSTNLWASQTSEEIQDYVDEPPVVRVIRGEPAPFTGALFPFNTARQYYEFRLGYEKLKADYLLNGPIDRSLFQDVKRDFAVSIILVSAGLALGTALSSASDTTKAIVLGAAVVGTVGSIVVLTF